MTITFKDCEFLETWERPSRVLHTPQGNATRIDNVVRLHEVDRISWTEQIGQLRKALSDLSLGSVSIPDKPSTPSELG